MRLSNTWDHYKKTSGTNWELRVSTIDSSSMAKKPFLNHYPENLGDFSDSMQPRKSLQ